MVVYRKLFPFFALSVLLGGCGTPAPHALNKPSIDAQDLFAEIQCSLDKSVSSYEKLGESNRWIRDWNVAFELTSDLTNTGEIGISALDWVIPHSPYPLAFGALGKVTRINQDKIVYKYKINFSKLKCPSLYYEKRSPENLSASTEALGFDKIFSSAQWVKQNSGQDSLPTFSFRRQFTLTTEGSAKPGFRIVNLSGAATGRLARSNINTLDMAFAGPPPKEAVAHVIVDNFPGKTGGGKPAADVDRLDRILQQGLDSLRNEPAY